jgi:hypothetical protein
MEHGLRNAHRHRADSIADAFSLAETWRKVTSSDGTEIINLGILKF